MFCGRRFDPLENSMPRRLLGKEKAGGSSPPVGSQFNSTVSLQPLVDFFSLKSGKEMLLCRGFASQLGVAGHSDWHHIHRGETVVGHQSGAPSKSCGKSLGAV